MPAVEEISKMKSVSLNPFYCLFKSILIYVYAPKPLPAYPSQNM